MTDYNKLALRADERSERAGDYWDNSARILRKAASLRSPIVQLTKKEWNWVSGLKQDLWEIGD